MTPKPHGLIVRENTKNNVSIASKVLKKLEGIDWDFEALSSKGDITSLHPYPARFIPSIPRTIIEAVKYYQGDLKVLDPFAGCGTTLTEAHLAGGQAVGIDVNGLANFLQTAYTTRYTSKDLDALLVLIRRISKGIRRNRKFFNVVNIPNLEHWFDEESVQLINTAIEIVNREQDSKMAKILGLLSFI
jgi:site-specific DNA-methyltransferase (cytosine-N4-specific)